MRQPDTSEMRARKERPVTPYATLAGFAIAHSVKDGFDDRAAQLGSRGSDGLTTRERDVLALISQGCSNKRIARTLEISPETVKSHVKNMFLKLGVSTRTEAVFRAVSLELL